jgi:hypothetical protein
LDGLTYQIKHATNASVDELTLEPVIVKVHEDRRSEGDVREVDDLRSVPVLLPWHLRRGS